MKIADIVRNGNMATFSHYCGGNLYYTVEYDGGTYLFYVNTDPNEVGTTTFDKDIKAITLMRYIKKCMATDEFIKIK